MGGVEVKDWLAKGGGEEWRIEGELERGGEGWRGEVSWNRKEK